MMGDISKHQAWSHAVCCVLPCSFWVWKACFWHSQVVDSQVWFPWEFGAYSLPVFEKTFSSIKIMSVTLKAAFILKPPAPVLKIISSLESTVTYQWNPQVSSLASKAWMKTITGVLWMYLKLALHYLSVHRMNSLLVLLMSGGLLQKLPLKLLVTDDFHMVL